MSETRPTKEIPNHRDIQAFRKQLISWYTRHGRTFPWRKKSATHYQKILAEIFLQRTRAETIETFLSGFINRFPSWKTLSMAKESDLESFLKPIGLWRQRAASLKALATEMAKRGGRFPKEREDIEKLPGVGQYIANSIFLFCHGKPEPLLDVNMARVLERFFGPRILADIRYDPYLQKLSGAVVNGKDPRIINWAILDFASKICLSSQPKCSECPINKNCKYLTRLDC